MLTKIFSIIVLACRAWWRWFVDTRETLAFTLAWGLLTWGIAGSSHRGWAISAGIYLLIYALLGIIPSLLKAAPPRLEMLPKHPNDL